MLTKLRKTELIMVGNNKIVTNFDVRPKGQINAIYKVYKKNGRYYFRQSLFRKYQKTMRCYIHLIAVKLIE